MRRRTILLTVAALACTSGNPEDSPTCAITMMASANSVLDQIRGGAKTLTDLPDGVEGAVPARVVGYGTTRALAASSDAGVVLGYEGEGFPAQPGFALVLVEDSAEVFKGVLIYDLDPPRGLPQLGTVSGATSTIPLFGTRVAWAAVSTERCPLFAAADTTEPE